MFNVDVVDKTIFPAYDIVMNVLLESVENLVPPEYFSPVFGLLMP
jgi:hypothetical protein